jgi:hypothetical protein
LRYRSSKPDDKPELHPGDILLVRNEIKICVESDFAVTRINPELSGPTDNKIDFLILPEGGEVNSMDKYISIRKYYSSLSGI